MRQLCSDTRSPLQVHESSSFVYSDTVRSIPCFKNQESGSLTFRIMASQGQQINITLIDLGAASSSGWHSCVNYGHIMEVKTMQQTRICGGQHRRRGLMLSNSNLVEIHLEEHTSAKFMLEFAGFFLLLAILFVMYNGNGKHKTFISIKKMICS